MLVFWHQYFPIFSALIKFSALIFSALIRHPKVSAKILTDHEQRSRFRRKKKLYLASRYSLSNLSEIKKNSFKRISFFSK